MTHVEQHNGVLLRPGGVHGVLQEPHHFEKTFFSDLQEALANLPAAVANNLCNLMETIKTTK